MSAYHAKKRLGQNFLHSPEIIERIVALTEPGESDTIIEIGPGRGALTLALAQTDARVIGVEFDRDLIGYLQKLLRKCPAVTIIHEDFLKYQPDTEAFKLIGNLPFNLTAPVIDWTIAHSSAVKAAVFMVQREVAHRLGAECGSRDWSPMSVMVQMHFDVELSFDVAAKHFRPPPKVTSSVVKLTPRPAMPAADNAFLETVLRESFRQRRKLLVNNLAPTLVADAAEAAEILTELGLEAKCRAEELTVEQFLKLTAHLAGRKMK
jgi:16S rRNA (adenine1518-N6/adenine1519-N6)-dimethyltransferase